MGLHFLKIAVVYLFIGAGLGLEMGITQKFVLVPVHAHLMLLGWASLVLADLVYHLYPAASATLLARVHFRLHNLGLPLFMVGLGLPLTGTESALPVVAGGATAVLVGVAVFATNVLLNVKPASRTA